MNGRNKPLIDLLKGWPNPALLPAAQIAQASSIALSDPAIATPALLYGPDSGYQPLREGIASWLTEFYQPPHGIPANRICITGGASQNIACILQVFSDPVFTRNVWMSSPTYFLAARIFEDNAFAGKLRSVPEDEEGMSVEYLRWQLQKSEEKAQAEGSTKPSLKQIRPWNKFYRHFIYAVPTFSNPSSVTMSLLRRQELVRLAREFDACIICDDVYDQLQWPADKNSTQSSIEHAELPRLVDIDGIMAGRSGREGADNFGNVVSNGTFSKIAGPGCRTGWAEGTAKFAYGLSQVGSSRSGGSPSQLTSAFMSNLLESGDLQRHIFQTLQPTYARRYRNMADAIEEYLVPLGVTTPQPNRKIIGGYFIWITLPAPLQAEEAASLAKRDENLVVAPGHIFAVPGDEKAVNLDRQVRLCFSWEDEDKLADGVRRLGQVIANMQRRLKLGEEVAARPPGNSTFMMEQYH
ncbi:hypothetical protein P7C71_g5532, partial [Lecanoromycetidae sp. Uapishka_2]